jgi:hypothetical protein
LEKAPDLSPSGSPQAALALVVTNKMLTATRVMEAPQNRRQRLSFISFKLCMVDLFFADDLSEVAGCIP